MTSLPVDAQASAYSIPGVGVQIFSLLQIGDLLCVWFSLWHNGSRHDT
jgi:hypothetical protein